MTTKSVPKPVRISEMMGFPKSADKIPGSEKRICQPVRVSEIMDSFTRSASRTAERSRKSTFLVPNRGGGGVRRKLYGCSPTPEKSSSRQSYYPIQANDKLPSKPPRTLLFSSTRALTKSSSLSTTASSSNSPWKEKNPSRKSLLPPRRSMLPQPNSIVNKLKNKKERMAVDKPAAAMSILEEDFEESENTTPKRISNITQQHANKQTGQLENDNNVSPEVVADYNLKNQTRPTVIKSIVTEHLRKLESEINDVKSTQKLILTKFETEINDVKSTQKLILTKLENLLKQNLETKTTTVDAGDEEKKEEEKKKNNNLVEKINDNDKENVKQSLMSSGGRRRSARLAAATARNDSFTNLEKELNITHSKAVVNDDDNIKTPLKSSIRKKSSKSDKPLREYLAIKASMTFLETPDGNRFKTRIVDDTPLRQKTLRRSISSKVFDELEDLYHDSSDSIYS